MANITLCPRCGGKLVPISERTGGFSGKKAVAGAIVAGPAGVAAGALGKKLVTLQCEKCGYTIETNAKAAEYAEQYGEVYAPIEEARREIIQREIERSLSLNTGIGTTRMPESSLGALLDAENLATQRKQNSVITISNYLAAAVREDGTVLLTGGPDPQAYNKGSTSYFEGELDEWANMVEEVKKWTDIVAVASGFKTLFGLRADGTVEVASVLHTDAYKKRKSEVKCWKDIISISSSDHEIIAGLHGDGTVVATGPYDVSDWEDIVLVECGSDHILGLHSDGTVIAIGKNMRGELDASGCKNVIDIFSSSDRTYGVRDDGFVYCIGDFSTFKLWQATKSELEQGIEAIAVSGRDGPGMDASFLRIDGTVLSVPSSEGRKATETWEEIVAVADTGNIKLGLRCDGTVVATIGRRTLGGLSSSSSFASLCLADLKTWRNIRVLPERKQDILYISSMRKKREAEEKKRREEEQKRQEEERRQQWKEQGKCQYCGGNFSFFGKKCKNCGKPKDY